MKRVIILAGLAAGSIGPFACLAAEPPNSNPPVIIPIDSAGQPVPLPPNAPPPQGDQRAVIKTGEQQPQTPPTGDQQPSPDLGRPDQGQPPEQTPPGEAANATPQPVIEQQAGATNTFPDIAMDATNKVLLPNGETGFLMNFRNVPLERVLDYLSSAAGFIINPEGSVRGTVTVWSNQPLSTNDAVKVLEQALKKNGYGLVRHEKLLTISTVADAKAIAEVKYVQDPSDVPQTVEIVTEIVPVHSLNAVQLVKDLAPFVSSDTLMGANDSGNALIITDTQTNIRRIMEIAKVLDSVSTSLNVLKVIPLKYADAKALATTISAMFPSQNTPGQNGQGGGFGRFRGGGPFGGGGFNPLAAAFGGAGNSAPDAGTGHTPTTRVAAASDDHSNSLIVSAPEDLMTLVTNMVTQLDVPVDAATEVHVFHLRNADPTEMTALLTSLYPDESGTTDASRGGAQFGGFRFPFPVPNGGNRQNTASDSSERMKVLGRVIAVADPRTASVVVTAAKEMMPQIVQVVEELDQDPARKMKVFAVNIDYADPLDMQSQLLALFPASSSSSSKPGGGTSGTSGTTINLLSQRLQNMQQNMQQNSSSFNSSSFGSGGGRGSNVP